MLRRYFEPVLLDYQDTYSDTSYWGQALSADGSTDFVDEIFVELFELDAHTEPTFPKDLLEIFPQYAPAENDQIHLADLGINIHQLHCHDMP